MVFDPTLTPTSASTPVRGTNVIGVRAYNERLVLSLVRRHGSLPKADITKLTGLSAQTISVIVRALEADGLLLRMEPRRGRIGQPSIPLRLDPDGAYSLGLKIGRRSAHVILMDFVGEIRAQAQWTYAYPVPKDIFAGFEPALREVLDVLTPQARQRLVGLGVAVPYELWNWAEQVGAPSGALDAWRDVNLQAELEFRCSFPVIIANDITAASGAELIFGNGNKYPDFVYFFIGAFIGGGVVLGGSLYPGRRSNAGALGSLPVPASSRSDGGTEQLIRSASLYRLEQRLLAQGHDRGSMFKLPMEWQPFEPFLSEWIEEASASLAHAIVAAVSIIDFGAAIIDGAFPSDVRQRLVEGVREKIAAMDTQGLLPFDVIEGAVGINARSIGAASLPLFARFLLDRDVLFKEEAPC
ncbi:ROK family transcriptional regulator [Beijerinckia indica]|uniref:ROK family protein n=1 Tax=Beijerinckia indica subsp. indica (strain ATCC 9039 / DSM 1715 / NCIMB 8712) TaxID=395963 RepID=B2IKF3_BEII9|nr:ROK family transcriptional regulator [Beijerinckia indica]ACB96433.1 ROK family protein [Beijerinckia indica subsp. indica ATCC 9039]